MGFFFCLIVKKRMYFLLERKTATLTGKESSDTSTNVLQDISVLGHSEQRKRLKSKITGTEWNEVVDVISSSGMCLFNVAVE